MSEILSREEFERVKEYAEFRAGKIKEMGVSDLFEATGGGADVPDWIPTIEALAAALGRGMELSRVADEWPDGTCESCLLQSLATWGTGDDIPSMDVMNTLREKGWIE